MTFGMTPKLPRKPSAVFPFMFPFASVPTLPGMRLSSLALVLNTPFVIPYLQCFPRSLQVNDCSNLPIGATCTIALHLHDDAGRRFDSNEGVNILYDVDMPQVVRVRLAPGNAELEVTGMSEGRAVIDVIASSHNGAPVTNYLPINVESGLAPGEKRTLCCS